MTEDQFKRKQATRSRSRTLGYGLLQEDDHHRTFVMLTKL
jgi:hypothetical protein